MFGMFKPKPAPEGPVTIDFDIEIERPAADVYALIDWADPRNAKREVGTVEPAGENRFRMQLDMLPDMSFDMTVTQQQAPRVYAFETDITPKIGRLAHNHERYEIEPAGEHACILCLTSTVIFDDGMTMPEFEEELTMMSVAVNNALSKLKIHAEQGVEAIREIEHVQTA